jgi:hypothetical protein
MKKQIIIGEIIVLGMLLIACSQTPQSNWAPATSSSIDSVQSENVITSEDADEAVTSKKTLDSECDYEDCYIYKGNIGSDILYAGDEEVPYVFISNDYIRLFFPDWAYYSPWSSGGRYSGHVRGYFYDSSMPSSDGLQMLTDIGIDTTNILSCTRYTIREKEMELLIVEKNDGKETWLAEWWKSEIPYVYKIERADGYELNIETDLDTGDELITMINLASPPVLNLSDPSVTKDEVLNEIRSYSEENERIVAMKYDKDEEKTVYLVFEYENSQLRSWVEYCFYDSESFYHWNKGNVLGKNGECNDNLLLTKVCYGYEVNLRNSLRGKSIEQMIVSLDNEGFQKIS